MAGTLFMTVAAGYWMLFTGAHPDYAAAFLPGMLIGGVSAGLTQAPLFAAAGTLPPDRATTGSAVLNVAHQVGSAVGVAVVVVVLGTGATHTVTDFHHVWAAEAIAGLGRLPGGRAHGAPYDWSFLAPQSVAEDIAEDIAVALQGVVAESFGVGAPVHDLAANPSTQPSLRQTCSRNQGRCGNFPAR